MMIDLKGKRAVISGASAGIGLEFTKQLHALGASVHLIARRESLLEEQVRQLLAVRPESASYDCADLTDPAALRGVADSLRSSTVDILINNAGFGSFGAFEQLDIEREKQMVALNVNATIELAHAVIPQMKAAKSGAIVGVSSIAAFQPLPYMATYAATKSFNLVHTLGLRGELAPFSIKVLAVCPGPVATEFGGVARVPGTLTGTARDSAEAVVRTSIKALIKNRAVVIPTLRGRLIALPSIWLPKSISTVLVARVLKRSLDLSSKPHTRHST